MLHQFREPGPHHIIGPCQGCIECGLIDRTWVYPGRARFPLGHQTFVHTQVGGELPDTHPLGIAKGTGLSS